jgi:putative flippase GtrA
MIDPPDRFARLVKELVRPAMYACVGATNTIVDIAIFALLTETKLLPPLYANVISFSGGALNSFVLNTLITFRDRPNGRWAPQRMFRFVLLTCGALAFSQVVLATLLTIFPSLVAKLLSVPIVFVFNYLLSNFFVFRD